MTAQNTNIPALRFPEFDGNWQDKKLSDIATIGRGKSKHRPRDAKFLFGGYYPFIQTGDIKHADLYLKEYSQTYSEEGLKQSKLWNEDTLCITIAANIAETAILKIKACFPDSIIGLIPFDKVASVVFIKYQFDKFKIKIQNSAQGVAQSNLNQDKLSNIIFQFPSFAEQQKIADFLTAVDERIQQLTYKKQVLEQYKKGVMQQVFSQQIRFKDEQGNDYPEWEEKRLGDVCELIHGYQFRTGDFTKEGIAVIKISNVIGTELSLSDLSFIAKERYDEFAKFEIHQGDVLMSLTGNIGRVIQVRQIPFRMVQNYRVGKFLPISESIIIKPFLKFLLMTDMVFGRFGQLSNQSAQANFGKQDMDKIIVMVPINVVEQQKIANFLNSMDDKINSVITEIEQTQLFKKGLLQQMFV